MEKTLNELFWDRIHYYGGPHNLSNAIEAECIKCNWKISAPRVKTPKRNMWKQWELNYLLTYWRCSKYKDIGLRINRTELSIVQKFYYLKKQGLIKF